LHDREKTLADAGWTPNSLLTALPPLDVSLLLPPWTVPPE
jgi:hypothetical protein